MDTSMTHKFVRVLRDGGRLMRCYTQNIDGLEAREGLVMNLKRGKGNKRRFMRKNWAEPRKEHTQGTDHDGGCEVVQLHGDLDTLRCSVCATQWSWTENETDVFMAGFAPRCKKCARKSDERQQTGKRGLAVGSLRPNIVLYGEEHPHNSLLSPFVPYDAGSQPEVLIIMGTSLKVFGLQKIIREFSKAVHAQKKGKVIFINRTKPAESMWDNFIDYFVPMDCDEWVEDLKTRRSDIWLRQGELDLKVTKKASAKRKRPSEDADVGKEMQSAKKRRIPVTEIPLKLKVVPLPQGQFNASVANAKTGLATPKGARIWVDKTEPSPVSVQSPQLDHERMRQSVLSPLYQARKPMPSPLGKDYGPQTPQRPKAVPPRSPRPPPFSPITPATSRSSNLRHAAQAYEDMHMEIPESQEEKENRNMPTSKAPDEENDMITVTPSKSKLMHKDGPKIKVPLVIKYTLSPPKSRSGRQRLSKGEASGGTATGLVWESSTPVISGQS
jgi:NAD-dependent SIR2 family protein deacetylase